ncbi:hypothetical protein IF1G_08297 [Cordyceps javanica]|uniref:Uncharacterized protein n=1 Tax=Cordyceps javanica TaxID=43265 RepID=A0A545UU49_9HYPO|nr:hypothetical protein IF1G_08297 [Cordyceps javanica]
MKKCWKKSRTMMTNAADGWEKWTERAAAPHKTSWRGHTFLSSLHVSELERRVLQYAVVLSSSWVCNEGMNQLVRRGEKAGNGGD